MKQASGLAIFLLLGLSGCSWLNSIGDHLPVMGTRCENWQCFTESGQEASDRKKAQEKAQSAGARTPVNPPDGGESTSPSPSPAAEKGPTPWDSTPTPAPSN